MDLSKQIFKAFKSKGLSITAQASKAVNEVLSQEQEPENALYLVLDEIRDRIEKREIKSSVIDVDIIRAVVADLSSSEEDLSKEKYQLMDAFSAPKIDFDENHKSYKLIIKPTYAIHGTVHSRANMYRERLNFTLQRLLRSGSFVLGGLSTRSLPPDVHEITTVTSLLGSTKTRVLFGMITQPEEGAWFLEDLSGVIRLDISRCQHHSHTYFYTEGCQVIVEGIMINSIFHAQIMGLPPAEPRATTLQAYGIEDTFETGLRPHQLASMKELEEKSNDTMFIILSDLHLDKPVVVERLHKVLEGFEQVQSGNIMFILIGNFATKSINAVGGRDITVNAFKALSDTIASYPFLANNARFLVVPGSQDAGVCGHILPRRAIPEYFMEESRKKIKHLTFSSNPSRLRFYTQEVVIFREDLLKKFQRRSIFNLSTSTATDDINSPSGEGLGHSYSQNSMEGSRKKGGELSALLANTIVNQGHLCPLPAAVKPIHWELDYTLRLSPLPHLLILADQAEAYYHDVCGCLVTNPGSFANDGTFLVYRPAAQEIEISEMTIAGTRSQSLRRNSPCLSHMNISALCALLLFIFQQVNGNTVTHITSYSEFESLATGSKFVLFNLHAPWCGHCKKLDPVLKAVTASLHRIISPAQIAYIDVSTTHGDIIAQELSVDGYPSLVPFEHGKRLPEYVGTRKHDAMLEYITNKLAPRVAWLDTTEQLDALLDRIDSRGLFSDSGNGILSVALTLLKSPIANTKEESKVSVGTSSTTAHATESCESVDGSDEKCQASRSSTNRNTGSTDTKNKNTQNDFHLNHREQYDMIKSAADKFDMTLFVASSSPELFERYNIQESSLLLFTSTTISPTQLLDSPTLKMTQLSLPTNTSRLLKDVVTYSIPATLSYSKSLQSFLRYLPCRSHVLVFMPSDTSSMLHQSLEAVTSFLASQYLGRLQFIFVATHHTNLFQYFEVTISDKDLPRIIIADMTEPSNMRKYVFPHSLVELATSDSLEGIHNSQSESSTPLQQLQAFFDSYLEGSLLPTLRSDAPDTAQKTAPVSVRDAVNILHGSTFQAMVMNDNDSDYFVYFTAPWCGFCKAVEPVIEELATYYKHDRRMKIGKIDMIKNDIAHPNVHIRAYPSFYLFLGDEKENPVSFDGERTAIMITQFIADERTKYRTKQRKPTI